MGITFKSIKYIYIYVYFYIFHFFSFFFFFFPFQVIDDIADRLLEFISKNLIFKNDEDNEERSDQDDGKISFELLRRSSSIPQEGDKNIVITDETVDGKEQNLLLLTTLKDNYYEKPYEKNIIGGLKEIAWQASHGQIDHGLTSSVLGEILWSIWKSLIMSLEHFMNRSLTINEKDILGEFIRNSLADEIMKLWVETVIV